MADESAVNYHRATKNRLLAERQMGEFLKQMPKAKGGPAYYREGARDGAYDLTAARPEAVKTLKEIGIDDKQSSRAQKLASIPEPEFQERIAVAKASGGRLMLRGRCGSGACSSWITGASLGAGSLRVLPSAPVRFSKPPFSGG